MKVTVLASGSKGNATYIETNEVKILIDAGISYRQIKNRLEQHDLDVNLLDAVLITHEHNDHIAGLDVLLKRTDAHCFITAKTYDGLYFKTKDNVNPNRIRMIDPYEAFTLGDLEIYPFPVSHDASDAVGYILKQGDKKIVFVTDTGYLPAKDFTLLENADLYIFESNYDVTMLFTSNRPFYLKQRIDSVKGHMSNTDSAYNMTNLVGPNTKRIILIHPSRECNTKELAIQTYKEVFTDYDMDIDKYQIIVATQDIPTEIVEI